MLMKVAENVPIAGYASYVTVSLDVEVYHDTCSVFINHIGFKEKDTGRFNLHLAREEVAELMSLLYIALETMHHGGD